MSKRTCPGQTAQSQVVVPFMDHVGFLAVLAWRFLGGFGHWCKKDEEDNRIILQSLE